MAWSEDLIHPVLLPFLRAWNILWYVRALLSHNITRGEVYDECRRSGYRAVAMSHLAMLSTCSSGVECVR